MRLIWPSLCTAPHGYRHNHTLPLLDRHTLCYCRHRRHRNSSNNLHRHLNSRYAPPYPRDHTRHLHLLTALRRHEKVVAAVITTTVALTPAVNAPAAAKHTMLIKRPGRPLRPLHPTLCAVGIVAVSARGKSTHCTSGTRAAPIQSGN